MLYLIVQNTHDVCQSFSLLSGIKKKNKTRILVYLLVFDQCECFISHLKLVKIFNTRSISFILHLNV